MRGGEERLEGCRSVGAYPKMDRIALDLISMLRASRQTYYQRLHRDRRSM